MAPNPSSVVHLPDGQTFVAQPVFGGLFFKSADAFHRQTPFPAGWTIVLHTELDASPPHGTDSGAAPDGRGDGNGRREGDDDEPDEASRVRKWTQPTLQNDTIFISSISNPSSMDFEPAKSMSRQMAMMLWVSLYWYFQQPAPAPYLDSAEARQTPAPARPQGDWRIRIKRDGVFRSRNMMPKLERMGLIATLDTAVGTSTTEDAADWDGMYVTRAGFWQIPTGLFLFTLQPRRPVSQPGSPAGSRPTSPLRHDPSAPASAPPPPPHPHPHRSLHSPQPSGSSLIADLPGGTIPLTLPAPPAFPIGPYYSSSHLPTYYPPPVLQYRLRDGVRVPVRPKPPRMGEIFYSRFVPSVAKYLSFRVASASTKPVPHLGPEFSAEKGDAYHLRALSDDDLLRRWLGTPRVAAFWGGYSADFLPAALKSKHSFPAIGMWDGVPFGYFEIYWVKEDPLGQRIDAGDWDRGLHVLIGEEWARGVVSAWLSSLVHFCWQADYRTMNVCLEPRVDNERFIQHLQAHGFARERQITFPHKQSWLCRLSRDAWSGPGL